MSDADKMGKDDSGLIDVRTVSLGGNAKTFSFADGEEQPKTEADNDWFVESPVPIPEGCPGSRINLAASAPHGNRSSNLFFVITVAIVIVVSAVIVIFIIEAGDGNKGKQSESAFPPVTAKSQTATKPVPRTEPLASTRVNEAQNGAPADMRFAGEDGEPLGIFVKDLPEGNKRVFFMKQSKSSDTVEIRCYSCIPSE